MLKQRVLTSIVGMLLVVVCVWFDTPLPWFTIMVAIGGMVAIWEFFTITGVRKSRILFVFGFIAALAFILQPHCTYGPSLAIILAVVVGVSLLLVSFMPRNAMRFPLWARTFIGILYVGLLLGLLVALRLEAGREWVFITLFATFGSDTLAFFTGRAFGKHQLAPHVSPRKTWEGTFGGIAGAIIVCILFTLDTPLRVPIGYGTAVILGLLISVFGQLGDLAESLLKRSFGVKDSGKIMPGHGGILDRLDSILFAGSVVYLYYTFIIA